jgi:3-deoxy-D-manno-octulosonic-acid transferase
VYLAYSLLLAAALLVSLPWWLLEMLRHGKYREGWRQRLGRVPERLLQHPASETIWIHAVSVGEVLAISRVVDDLRAQLPGCRLVISTTTDTGQNLARERFGQEHVFYVPLDFTFAIRPYLRALHIRVLVLAESEFWPNLLRLARESGASVAVVNARISDRSLPGYLRFRALFGRIMQNVQLFLAQSDEDARRLIAIGAPAARVRVGGNLKFEIKPPSRSTLSALLAGCIERENIRPVVVAGSTLEGEEPILLDSMREVLACYPRALLILAPRHPQRFDAVAALLTSSGLRFARRSHWQGSTPLAGSVLLLDSIGELAALYAFADLAFIGGSLVPRGGHNVLEAAQFGKAILVGPHTENFREMVETFRKAGALRVVTPESLTSATMHLLEHDDERASIGSRAAAIMGSQQGATARTVTALLDLLSAAEPTVSPEPAERRV